MVKDKEKDPKSSQPFIRRDTVVEQAAEGLIEEQQHRLLQQNAKPTVAKRIKSFGKAIYNHENREFLGRDAIACFQLSMFYFIFYTLLSAFFIGMLAVFYTTIDLKKPTYYNNTSVMNHRKVNPGLGFRPQINPEDMLIRFNKDDVKSWRSQHVETLENFLKIYYESSKRNLTFEVPAKKHNRTVDFDISIFNNTPCSPQESFGYGKGAPCVLIKMNRIYGWEPNPYPGLPPQLANVTDPNTLDQKHKYVYIHCDGANSFDKDNVGKIHYYSLLQNRNIAGIPVKYYPYINQRNYLSPVVFAHFQGITKNTLIEIECRAYAKNIDSDDRLNLRGMTKFELFVEDNLTIKD